MNEKWYAVYTKPRWEKKVAAALTTVQVENYCPLNRVVKQWSDRKKMVYEPLFTSYVFVRIDEKQNAEIREINGILNFVHWLGRPAVIRDVEIQLMMQFLDTHSNVRVECQSMQIRDTIRITGGPLMNRHGKVLMVNSNTVKVELHSLGCIMYAELKKANVELVRSYHQQIA
jgi:transcription antitermination factor NusG